MLLIFLFACGKKPDITPTTSTPSKTPPTTAPITPPTTPPTTPPVLNGNLLTGWWAPSSNSRYNFNLYFGTDNFSYIEPAGNGVPSSGYWRIAQDSIYFGSSLNGYVDIVYAVSKLTTDSLVFSILGSNIVGSQRYHRINRVAITSTAITTIAGSQANNAEDGLLALEASFYGQGGIITDSQGNIYFSDRENSKIEKITIADGIIHTIAGTGSTNPKPFVNNIPALSADLVNPTFLTMDASGNIYFSEEDFGNRVDKISAIDGKITCVAGSLTAVGDFTGDNGLATAATLKKPAGVAVDVNGNLYISDEQNYRIREITVSDGKIKTIAGTGKSGYSGDGGPAVSANIVVRDLSLDAAGNIYFTDYAYHCIRKITVSTGIITTVAGNGSAGSGGDGGPAKNALLNSPYGLKVSSNGTIYFSETGSYDIRKIDGSTGIINRIAGNGYTGYSDGIHATACSFINPCGVTVDASGNVYVNDALRIRKVSAN